MPELHKFPSIEQFRNAIHHVRNKARYTGKDAEGNAIYNAVLPLPTLDFVGTVKLHGTNAAVCQSADGQRWFQSRERIITPEDDNQGFSTWATGNSTAFDTIFNKGKEVHPDYTMCLYGEWCGQGIQSNVAISILPKMFVVFAIKFVKEDRSFWVMPGTLKYFTDGSGIKSSHDFPFFFITIDFGCLEEAQNKLVELTEAVENNCPVGKVLGVEGVGEGIVWTCNDPTWDISDLWFKVKGEKHSVSKVKTLAAIDIEKVNSIKECVDKIVTENRLKQGLDHLCEMKLDLDIKNLGAFLKWLASDTIKEEIDTIIGSGLEPKDVGKQVTTVGRLWFMKQLENVA